ncbi:hypothetical protein AVL48_27170 [Amycolatopsis regifaucium]|uniref:Uncharacterized protein n=1 Tax=Amycolatopsis regifaucium TaxID=546365 RepID=A0A154MP91_9PSEU|nr:hypothetical protein AVL48_27170 [Amycolatopsis regifaucium]
MDRGDAGTEPQVDLVLGVPALVVHEGGVGPSFPDEYVLRQRRPFVRTLLLVAEQYDPPVEPLVA